MYPDLSGAAPSPSPVTTEYRPHGNELQSPVVARDPAAGRPQLPLTGAWQRLAEARAPGGIRVLTLWHATAGSVALHAGKHGGPSLQWTSTGAVHGATPHALFDHLVASSEPMVR